EERASAGELAAQVPDLGGGEIECKRRMNELQAAQFSAGEQFLQVERRRFEVFAVGGHQLHVVRAAGLHHSAAFRHVIGQRLLAENVLTGGGRAQGEVHVSAVVGGDVNGFDFRIAEAVFEAIVGEIARGVELRREPLGFLRVAADQSHQARFLRVPKSGQNGAFGNVSEADNRKSYAS